jgi:hypothetical protein
MMLGAMDKNNKIGVTENDFDFSVLNNDVQTIKQQQKYILIGLAILLILILSKR